MFWRDLTGDLSRVAGPFLQSGRTGFHTPAMCLGDYGAHAGSGSKVISFAGTSFEKVDIARYRGSGIHRVNRSIRHTTEDKRHDYLLSIPIDAEVQITRGKEELRVEPGNFVLLDTSRHFDARSIGKGGDSEFELLHARISGETFRSIAQHADEYCFRRIGLSDGSGTLLRSLVELGISIGRSLSASQSLQFETMLTQAIISATVEAPEIAQLKIHSVSPNRVGLWRQAQAFIDQNLSNPALDAAMVAQHCRISKRYLHACFADTGQTLVHSIKLKRLEKCRQDLRNVAHARLPMAQIAIRWGFNDIPHFCRSYKDHFGMSPGSDR